MLDGRVEMLIRNVCICGRDCANCHLTNLVRESLVFYALLPYVFGHLLE